MKTVKVDKDTLLKELKTNLQKHRIDLDKMAIEYRNDSLELLKQLVEDFRINIAPKDIVNIRWPKFPPKPISHTEDYETAIKMVEMSIEVNIELSESEFVQLVMDQWGWKHEFEMTKTLYGL